MREYYYLIASLPMLEFGAKPPMSYVDFLKRCRGQLCSDDMRIIGKVKTGPSEAAGESRGVLKEWKDFDIALRNEIAKQRALKLTRDPLKYIRGEDYSNPFESVFAHWAVSQDSPIRAELYLDRVRWEKIEEFSKGHYFDIGFLIGYALKLQILERWQNINKESGAEILQDMIKV